MNGFSPVLTKQVDLGMSHRRHYDPHLVLANHHMSLHGPHTDPPTAEGISGKVLRDPGKLTMPSCPECQLDCKWPLASNIQ